MRRISIAAALTFSSAHGEAIASSDEEPVIKFILMLSHAKLAHDGHACLAALYALARLWKPPFPEPYLSKRKRHDLRLLTLETTWHVLTTIQNLSRPDSALIQEIQTRLALEKAQWAHEGPIRDFFRAHLV